MEEVTPSKKANSALLTVPPPILLASIPEEREALPMLERVFEAPEMVLFVRVSVLLAEIFPFSCD